MRSLELLREVSAEVFVADQFIVASRGLDEVVGCVLHFNQFMQTVLQLSMGIEARIGFFSPPNEASVAAGLHADQFQLLRLRV